MLTSNPHAKTVSFVMAAWYGDGSLKMVQTQGQKESYGLFVSSRPI